MPYLVIYMHLFHFSGEGKVQLRILHVLSFDSHRKRMSVIVEHPITKEVIVYCKGADSAIMTNLKPRSGDEEEEQVYRNTQDHLLNYARHGLRTLCMAKRVSWENENKC